VDGVIEVINKNVKLFNAFLNLIAFGFVVLILFKTEWNTIRSNLDIKLFILASVFCVAGFFFQAFSWFALLRLGSFNVSIKDAVCSVGITIFSKYIPGKVWMILGRVGYLLERYTLNKKKLASFSLLAQILSLLVAFFVSFLLTINNQAVLNQLNIQVELALIISFTGIYLLTYFLKRFFLVSSKHIFIMFFVSAFMWLFWGIGFAFLYYALNIEFEIRFSELIATFIFSALVGILAFIVPGGLGVREASMVSILSILGLNIHLAISIAAISRVWFLISEIVFFFMCNFLKKSGEVSKIV
jgi:uncharacterized membrane protein YbhN (UPF0104 family)